MKRTINTIVPKNYDSKLRIMGIGKIRIIHKLVVYIAHKNSEV